jgi:hypothetical protein
MGASISAPGAYAALAAYLKFHKLPEVDLDFIPHSTYRALPVEDNPAFTPDAEVFLYSALSYIFIYFQLFII